MRKKLLWAALAVALSIPAVGWAGAKALSSRAHCPLPCPDCPLAR